MLTIKNTKYVTTEIPLHSFIHLSFFLIPEPALTYFPPFSPALPNLSRVFPLNWWYMVTEFLNLLLECFSTLAP